MMNKINKIFITLIITITAILGINTISHGYHVGQNLTISYWQYARSKRILCMEHGQNLMNTVSYKIVSHVKIEGNKSTDHKGKTIESWNNAKMAAILCSNRSVYTVKNAVWNYGYTWMKQVGRHHAGVKLSFANNTKGVKTKLDKEATEYANSLKDEKLQISDKTDKTKIKTVSTTIGNQSYVQVGPFNWNYSGDLSDVKVYDQNSKEIEVIKIGIYKGKELEWKETENISSDKDFYIALPVDKGVTKLTKISASINTKIKNVDIWFLEAVNKANQNLILTEPKTKTEKVETQLNYDILLQGSLKVIKVNKNNEEVKLKDVGFYIQNKNTGKYVKQDDKKQVTYVNSKTEATEFITDVNGEILVENLMLGTYVAYETKNPNYGYIINQEGHEKEVVIDKTEELKIPNQQQFIKLSGYVWQDEFYGKKSDRNYLYQNDNDDTRDILVEGIVVRLKDKSGNTIKQTKTDKNGAYRFQDVAVSELANYYIEFEYDGLTYEPVIANLAKNNGSKAVENTETRKSFNNNFAVIEGNGEQSGITKNTAGNKVHDLSYEKDKNQHTSTLIKNNNNFKMISTTSEAGYFIKDYYTGKEQEITNINFGIYEREQPDLAIMNDIQNAKITLNGYEHTYQYAKRFQNQSEYESGWNVGVKFGDEYGSMSYTRVIYKSDVEYNSQDASKELKVYITYKMQIRNESTNLLGQVNSLVDYYDARYTIKKIGTALDESGNITSELQFSESQKYNDKYLKTEIYTNSKIEAQKTLDIYVQFELNRKAVLSIMNDNATFDNVVEITSYTSYDKSGNIYGGVDLDSNPGNTVPGDKTTYEDDTDSAPSLKLEITNEREITGKVFLDETDSKLLTAQIREGDGQYKDGEKGIKDVEVTLKDELGNVALIYDETIENWVEATAIKTDENGDFKIAGFIPGKYQIMYTWGDETYTVQNYKGTIYQEKARANNLEWYKTENPRYSDAMDDWTLRQTIDTETAKGETKITQMTSTTPKMEFGVEYESAITDGTDDKLVFRVKNIDFGIVERPIQQLSLDKHVKSVKITLDNGTVIIDATVNEKGKLEGQISGLTGGPSLGFVKAELDNEILQKANIEIGYEIVATNIGENDYISANGDYYFYGEKQAGNNKGELLKLKIGDVKDYLDNTLSLGEGQEDLWQIDSEDTTIEGRKTYITKKLSENQLAPTEQVKVEMKASKDLANEDEINFENLAVVTSIKTTPGTYGPKVVPPQDEAEPVIVTTPQGANLNYILPITIGLSTLMILGAGIWLIKKKVLNK